ncbi:putative bifunctional diguanylate cyclase/phosphodiesterase [Dactylosporangium sp. CA-233914]|uniref:putative bifunctional diguanylate cyclase/phosphodiesterase n=1 Tax=Dactylosporangium sp. CA-233914 TaxID=3239934 RepID=UPI003D8A0B0E
MTDLSVGTVDPGEGGVGRMKGGERADTRPLLLACLGVFGFGLVWTALFAAGLPAPRVIMWLTVPATSVLAGLTTLRVARTPGLPRAARRFWAHIAVVEVLVLVGASLMTAGTFGQWSSRPLVFVASAVPLLSLALLVVMWALLRLPVGHRSRSEWIRLTLDGATVTAGAALFLWHFVLRPLVQRHTDVPKFLGMLFISLLCLLALVAVMKVVLVGSGPVSSGSLRLLALTILIGVFASAGAPITNQPRWVGLQPISIIVNMLVVSWAAHVQRRRPDEPAPAQEAEARRNRHFSILPYLAVGATALLLAVESFRAGRGGTDIAPVACGVIFITGIVVARQLVALRDNAHLLDSVSRHEQQLQHQATHDALTGLANRTGFAALVGEILAREDCAAVLLIDLDDFKEVNDTLGHAVGDDVLVAVAERLRAAVRASDVVARLGGDEFAVLLRHAPAGDADRAAERMLSLLAPPVQAAGHHLLVHASIGVAPAHPGDDLGTLLRKADIAMYAAKDRGKGSAVEYTPDLAARIQAHAELAADLRDAIGTERLFLRYQPIMNLATGAVFGVETLMRFDHPTRGPVSPAEFIPVAEQSGMIVPLGRWALHETCRQAAAWLQRFGPDSLRSIAVNVAGRQLQDPGFVDDVRAALAASALPAARLLVEVTETAVLNDGQAIATLHELRALGVRIALDDFGTAASSLGLLVTCPVTTLKLDRSFVAEITAGGRPAAVAQAVIAMARTLELQAVAEGIETEAQAEALRRQGYELGQGFLYARPLAAGDLEQLLGESALSYR